MISKKKIREKVIDIFHGAGMHWLETEQYFDNFSLEALGNAILGMEEAFGLGESRRLRAPWRLKEYDDPDTIAGLVREALEIYKGNER